MFIFRRSVVWILGFIVIFFVSSPTVLFTKIKEIDSKHVLDFDWVPEKQDSSFIKEHIPPLIIIAINYFLIYLIDIVTLLEAHETHSLYQRAYYIKAVIFLIVNMLIIPSWTLSQFQEGGDLFKTTKQVQQQSSSLFSFMTDRGFNVTLLLSEFYKGENGTFFVSLII